VLLDLTNIKIRKKNIKICKYLHVKMTIAGILLLSLHIVPTESGRLQIWL